MPKTGQTAPRPGVMRPLRLSLPLKLLEAREAVMERFRPHLQAHGVTEQQWRVLRALAEVGESDVSALAGMICLLPPSLSRIVPDLEARGLVCRRTAARDRRSSLGSLTAQGRALFDTMSTRSEAIYREIEAALDAAHCRDILVVLDRFIGALKPGTPGPQSSATKSRSKLTVV